MKQIFIFPVKGLSDSVVFMAVPAVSVTAKNSVLVIDGVEITIQGSVSGQILSLPLETNLKGKDLSDLYLLAMRLSLEADTKRLRFAFERMEDKTDWRNPIDCKLFICADEVNTYREAVIHFTGTVPTIEALGGGQYHVKAAGYRAGPAGP